MDELFGVPMWRVVAVLALGFLLVAVYLVYIAVRSPILVRMAFRSAARRPGRSGLIVVGLMLGTAIISSSFTTGDSVTFSLEHRVVEVLQGTDELIRLDEDSDVWEGQALPEDFPDSIFDQIAPVLDASPYLDAVAPLHMQSTAVMNFRSQQFEVQATYTGLDPARAAVLEPLRDVDGNLIDLASLGPNEVYIDQEGAEAIEAQVGDELGVVTGPGRLTQVTVKGVAEGWYFKTTVDDKLVLMAPLAQVQQQLGKEGRLTHIILSNTGDHLGGVALTDSVIDAFGDLPAITESGLYIYDFKQDAIDTANQVGSLFVSMFTTFGLFSIGAGILLIFLIFSMLSAERRSEMGMARAVGMQRSHLVRQFVAEGAFYGLGSTAVGALAGIGLGYVVIAITGSAFAGDSSTDLNLTTHVELRSVLASFLLGSMVTFVTILLAARQNSRLNIVRAVRGIAEPPGAAGKGTLIWGVIVLLIGALIAFSGYQSAQSTAFGLGMSFIPIGIALILRWLGVAQRLVLTGAGVYLLVLWLMPTSVWDAIRDDWRSDLSGFFVSGFMIVAGAVLVTINNSPTVLGLMTNTLGRIRPLTPIIKSAVAYPLRFGFRTGMSVAMFAVVVFSVVVMSIFIEGFGKLLDDQHRLGGGYEVVGFAQSDLSPISDLGVAVDLAPDLAFVTREDGSPSVGALRTIWKAEGRLAGETDDGYRDTAISGLDDDFIETNEFRIRLATSEYLDGSEFDAERIWRDLRDKPGLAVVNASMVPTRDSGGFQLASDNFALDGVEGLFLENDVMEPVDVTLHDLESASAFDLKVVAVLDDLASQGIMPSGVYTSTRTLAAEAPRDVNATRFFFNVDPGTDDAADRIEAALISHAIETIDISETVEDLQALNRAIFDLLIGFMMLGLVVGIAALGVISARAVVERRQQIGVLRSIGFSRRMVLLIFLSESSFISILGIAWGVALGILTSINFIADVRNDEPSIELIIPWARLGLIVLAAYVLSLLTTVLPARQAGRTAPAEALRYE